jgi:hypothetical protein
MAAIMRPAGAPGGLRLDAMTRRQPCSRPPGVASWGFKSLARKTGPVSGRDCGAGTVRSKREAVTVLPLVAGLVMPQPVWPARTRGAIAAHRPPFAQVTRSGPLGLPGTAASLWPAKCQRGRPWCVSLDW